MARRVRGQGTLSGKLTLKAQSQKNHRKTNSITVRRETQPAVLPNKGRDRKEVQRFSPFVGRFQQPLWEGLHGDILQKQESTPWSTPWCWSWADFLSGKMLNYDKIIMHDRHWIRMVPHSSLLLTLLLSLYVTFGRSGYVYITSPPL